MLAAKVTISANVAIVLSSSFPVDIPCSDVGAVASLVLMFAALLFFSDVMFGMLGIADKRDRRRDSSCGVHGTGSSSLERGC